MKKWWSLLGLCLLACSSSQGATSGGEPDAGADATAESSVAAAVDAPNEAETDAGAGGCNDLANLGAVVSQTYVATAPVTGGGGTLVSGTYVLTAAVAYSGAGGATGTTGTTFRDTAALDAAKGTYERVASIINAAAGFDGTPIHQSGSFTLSGASIKVVQTCPEGPQPFTSYDADATTLRLYAPAAGPGNPPLMFEYTKR